MKLTDQIEVSNYTDVVLRPGTEHALHWTMKERNCKVFYLQGHTNPLSIGRHTSDEMAKMIKHYINIGYRIVISWNTINIKAMYEP